MSSTAIKFEVQLPNSNVGSPSYNAIQTFIANMETLGTIYQQESSIITSGSYTQTITIFGLISSIQATTALGFLNTLNTALGLNVPAISYSVNIQP